MLQTIIRTVIKAVITVLAGGLLFEGIFRATALGTGRLVMVGASGHGVALQTVAYRPGRCYVRLAVQ